jgi:ArsR family transcriptional regulator
MSLQTLILDMESLPHYHAHYKTDSDKNPSNNVITGTMAFDKNKTYEREADILKALGHPIRLKIVAGLLAEACNVKKIWECLGLPQATVSQHLALLKNKGIIEGHRNGVEVFYTVISDDARRIVAAVFQQSSPL